MSGGNQIHQVGIKEQAAARAERLFGEMATFLAPLANEIRTDFKAGKDAEGTEAQARKDLEGKLKSDLKGMVRGLIRGEISALHNLDVPKDQVERLASDVTNTLAGTLALFQKAPNAERTPLKDPAQVIVKELNSNEKFKSVYDKFCEAFRYDGEVNLAAPMPTIAGDLPRILAQAIGNPALDVSNALTFDSFKTVLARNKVWQFSFRSFDVP